MTNQPDPGGAVSEIRQLHRKNPGQIQCCLECRGSWPCRTVEILERHGCD